MALTAEQKRKRRADAAASRDADAAARGIKRRRSGSAPAHKNWDEQAGKWVLDESVASLHPTPSIAQPDDLLSWAVANKPPRRRDFTSLTLFDAAREPWYATLMGKLLPPYGDNAARATAWRLALKRHVRMSAAHTLQKSAQQAALDNAMSQSSELRGKEFLNWAVCNPPPELDLERWWGCDEHGHWKIRRVQENCAMHDVKKEAWYKTFTGEQLPPRTDAMERTNAYRNAVRRREQIDRRWCAVHEVQRTYLHDNFKDPERRNFIYNDHTGKLTVNTCNRPSCPRACAACKEAQKQSWPMKRCSPLCSSCLSENAAIRTAKDTRSWSWPQRF